MLSKLFAGVHARRYRLDALDLSLGDNGMHVLCPTLDEGHERSVAEGSIGSAEGEVIRECGDRDGEVGCHAVCAAPELAEVGAVGDEGEAREPGGVEAGGADDYVDVVGNAIVVDEAGGSDGLDVVSEDGHVGGREGFEVAWGGGGTAAADVEIFRDHAVAEARVRGEVALHVRLGGSAGGVCFGGAFDDELEALIKFVFDLFAVLEVLFGIVPQQL